MAAPVFTESGFATGVPVPVGSDGSEAAGAARRIGFSISADGQQILEARQVADTTPSPPVNVVLNWRPGARP
jgi:hypothetical protein